MAPSPSDITKSVYEKRLEEIEVAEKELGTQQQGSYSEEEKELLRTHLKEQKKLAKEQLNQIKRLQALEQQEKKLTNEVNQAKVNKKYIKAAIKNLRLKAVKRKRQRLNDKINQNISCPKNEFADNTLVGDPCVPCMIKELKKKIKIKKEFPGQQKYSNCGVQSSLYLMKLVSCPGDISGLDEDTLLDDSMDAGYADREANRDDSGATTLSTMENIISDKGVSTRQIQYSSKELGDALSVHQPVILAVDVNYLHPATDENGNSIKTGWEENSGGGHAVTAVDGQYNNKGELTNVLIADTGVGKQYWMKIKDFEEAINNLSDENKIRAAANKPLIGATMNVSNDPIKSECPNE